MISLNYVIGRMAIKAKPLPFLLLFLLALPLGRLYAAPIDTDSLLDAQKREAHRLPCMMAGYEFNINVANDASFAHELDFHWYFLKYVGVGFGIELDKYTPDAAISHIGLGDDSYDDYKDYDPDDIVKFNFHPMLSFRTPPVWFSHDGSWGLMLRCDPGLVMSLPANDRVWISPGVFPSGSTVAPSGNVKVTNHGGKWLFWRVRTALSLYNELGMVSVGYSFSDYNINYCRNNMVYRGQRFYGRDHYSHTGTLFVALSVCF